MMKYWDKLMLLGWNTVQTGEIMGATSPYMCILVGCICLMHQTLLDKIVGSFLICYGFILLVSLFPKEDPKAWAYKPRSFSASISRVVYALGFLALALSHGK